MRIFLDYEASHEVRVLINLDNVTYIEEDGDLTLVHFADKRSVFIKKRLDEVKEDIRSCLL